MVEPHNVAIDFSGDRLHELDTFGGATSSKIWLGPTMDHPVSEVCIVLQSLGCIVSYFWPAWRKELLG